MSQPDNPTTPRGFLHTLTARQKKAALEYDGPENHGDPAFRVSSFPTHTAASRIAEAARRLGFNVERSAASPFSKSAYVKCNDVLVRVADHPTDKRVDIDVHTDQPRLGSVTWDKAVEWLRGRIPNAER